VIIILLIKKQVGIQINVMKTFISTYLQEYYVMYHSLISTQLNLINTNNDNKYFLVRIISSKNEK